MQFLASELPAGSAADPTAGDRKVWAIVAYVMTGLTVLLFLFTLVMLRRIKIAVATLKVGLKHASCRHKLFWAAQCVGMLCVASDMAFWASAYKVSSKQTQPCRRFVMYMLAFDAA